MPQINIRVIDRTNLPQKLKSIIGAAEHGVKLATEEGVEFIRSEIFTGKYTGHQYYPDVKPSTKRIKAKKGREIVGVDTGNLRDSFNSDVKGLAGTIRGGGGGYSGFLSRWQIDSLFMEVRAKRTREIIEGEIKKKI